MFGIDYLHNNTNDIINMLNQSREQYLNNNVSDATQTLENLIDKFDKIRPTLCILINHSEILKIETSLLKLKSYMQKNNDTLFEVEYYSLVFTVGNIYESEILNLANLF